MQQMKDMSRTGVTDPEGSKLSKPQDKQLLAMQHMIFILKMRMKLPQWQVRCLGVLFYRQSAKVIL